MKTYTVYLSMLVDAYVEVEADSPEAAIAEARQEVNPFDCTDGEWHDARIVENVEEDTP